MTIALTLVLTGMTMIAVWTNYFHEKEKVLVVPLFVTLIYAMMTYVFVRAVMYDSGSPVMFVIFAVLMFILVCSYIITPRVRVYTACGCSDDVHDDPSCSRYGKKDV